MTSDNANYPKKRNVRKPMMNYGDEDSDSSATSSSSGPEITFSAVKKLKKQRQSRISAALEQHESGDQSSSKNLQKRMRRRSSARFLRLSYSENNNSKDLLSESSSATREDLGNMYKTVMKLNNENKINATNSWGLKLIENLDKVLEYDEENVERDASENHQSSRIINGNNEERGINFTKASCTLDASVKIYSYRVDDAHLTSYKVLANLNRTESSNSNKNGASANHQDGEETTTNSTKKGEKQRTATDTIESNLSNINMNKLDSAYDIDPLFHKMSKKFDEGGAKGLLLANLDIAMDSCAIVFDSKDDNYSLDELKPPAEEASQNIKQLDVSSLVSNLRSLLNGVSIQSIPLVPQLESLREEYKQLDAEGHIVSDDQLPRSERYANSVEEEKEAERSIHLEAIERSRMSAVNLTLSTSVDSAGRQSSMSYAAHDFGGDDDDDSYDGGFNDFLVMEDTTTPLKACPSPKVSLPPSMAAVATSTFLDMICTTSGSINTSTGGSSSFGFIHPAALEKFVSGNSWAGAAHWKKCSSARKKKNEKENVPVDDNVQTNESKTKNTKKKGKATSIKYVDLYSKNQEVESLFEAPKKSKKSRKDPLQLTDAMKKKSMKTNNCLPMDSSISIQDLTSLFGRPNTFVRSANSTTGNFTENSINNAYDSNRRKTVAFYDSAQEYDDGGDDSYNDGPGFHFAGDEDSARIDDFTGASNFVEKDIEGIRRVEKVSIGFATVAKKVDVRSLKKNLWAELEARIVENDEASCTLEENSSSSNPSRINAEQTERETASLLPLESSQVSFQSIVKTMDYNQTQTDVTVPFYFICLLHLANEKGLTLDSSDFGLDDFLISVDKGESAVVPCLNKRMPSIASQKGHRSAAVSYVNVVDEDSGTDD